LGLKGLKCEQVTLADHKTAGGADFYAINPKGNVPTIVLTDATVLNENVATLLFLGDSKMEGGLTAPHGTKERLVLHNELAFVATEVHKSMGAFFIVNDNNRAFLTALLDKTMGYLDKHIAGKTFIANGKLSVADFYLYVLLSWNGYLKVDLTKWSNVNKYFLAMKELDVIKAAHAKAATNPAEL